MIIKRYITGPLQVNTYLVVDDETKEAMIVDPGDYSERMVYDIDELKCNLKYIFLTHGHVDHIGGVEELLKSYPSAKLVAGKNEIEILENPSYNSSLEFIGKPISISVLKENQLVEGDKLYLGQMEFRVIETSGHTPGGLSLYTDGLLFSGDTLFKLSIGRTDFYGGNFKDLINAIKNKLFVLPDDTLVLPGHMDSTQIGYEKKYNQFL